VLRSIFELGRKNVRGIHKGLPFRTNRAGFRGGEYTKEPAAGVFRIVVGGDSVTMGSGVLEEEAYPARLEQRLNREAGGKRYEVLNLGLSGLNTRWVVNRIETIGLAHHPHLIVYGYTLNDIEGPAYVSTIEPSMVREKRRRYRRFVDSPSHLLRAVWPRWLALSERLVKPPGTLEYDVHYNYFENPVAWEAVSQGLDRLAERATESGVCVHLLIHTGTAQLNRLNAFLPASEKVEAAAKERGFSVTQTFPYFQGHDPSALRLSFADTHPNAAGHELIRDALYDGLRALPDRCWSVRRW
jgi:lysophospholipase L1-like esterase